MDAEFSFIISFNLANRIQLTFAPEPAALALFALGGLLITRKRR